MQCVRRVQINIVVATPPEVRLAPCNLGPPSNSREQPGVIPGSCPWEKSPLSTMDQYLYSRLHASIYLDRSCLRFMKLCTKSTNGDTEKNGERECIADISLDTTGGGVLFSSWCTFNIENAKFWLILVHFDQF